MGFIFGIVNLKGGSVNPEDVRTLGKAVQWDGFDSRIAIDSSYGWGYCWNKKSMPKAGIYTDERVAVLCDARIYNSDDLKQSLEFEQSEEAFAKAYLKWGDVFADKFNGDFAAVIIDILQQKVLLVRDHIGVRPLTYSIKDDLLIFASHEFGIAKSNLVNNSLSETTLIRTFYLRKKQEYSSTVFQRIKKIIPGYVSTVTSSKVSEIKYWIPEKIKNNKHLTFEMAVSYLREHLIKSVQVRMEQGKIGTHVSGGIDSSGVGAILADYIDDKKRLKGYSWSPQTIVQEVDGLNEKELVDEFSKQKGIEIDYLTYSNQADIDDFILPEFEQMPIEIYTMLQASKDEINTMFSGWGGDEFVSLSLRGSMNHIILRLKLLTLYRWIKFWGIKATVARAKGEILPLLDPLGMFDSNAISRLRLNLFQFVFIMKHWRLFFFQREKLIYGFGDRNGFVLRLLYRYHLPQRMDSWALFGEKFGLDYKFPLLDKHLLEYWFTIPIKFTYEGMCHRFLYREAMKNILTDSIRKRTDKDESVLIQNNSERRLLLRKKIAELPELFVNSPLLKFFKADEFYKCATKKAPERTACIVGMYDIRFFLRYKSLVEKYLIHNQIFMNSRKEE